MLNQTYFYNNRTPNLLSNPPSAISIFHSLLVSQLFEQYIPDNFFIFHISYGYVGTSIAGYSYYISDFNLKS